MYKQFTAPVLEDVKWDDAGQEARTSQPLAGERVAYSLKQLVVCANRMCI